ncbi:hypothetical protein J2X72_004239 [Phyllobacterium sp. 1468]|nr:hypothetical protein [Phyllobacterium sp. 1468]
MLENTPKVHNLIVCTLCSCYPRPVLGLPPDWYKLKPNGGNARHRTVSINGVLRIWSDVRSFHVSQRNLPMTHIVVHSAPCPLPISPQELLPWAVFVGILLLLSLYFVGDEQGAT